MSESRSRESLGSWSEIVSVGAGFLVGFSYLATACGPTTGRSDVVDDSGADVDDAGADIESPLISEFCSNSDSVGVSGPITYSVRTFDPEEVCTTTVQLYGEPCSVTGSVGSIRLTQDHETGLIESDSASTMYVRDLELEALLKDGFEQLGVAFDEGVGSIGVHASSADVDGVSFFLINADTSHGAGSYVAMFSGGEIEFIDLGPVADGGDCNILDLNLDGRSDLVCYSRGAIYYNLSGQPDDPGNWRSFRRTVGGDGVSLESGSLGGITRVVAGDGSHQALLVGVHHGADALLGVSTLDLAISDDTPPLDIHSWWGNPFDLTFSFMPWLAQIMVEGLDGDLPPLPYRIGFDVDGSPRLSLADTDSFINEACNRVTTRFESFRRFFPEAVFDAMLADPRAQETNTFFGAGTHNPDYMSSYRFFATSGIELIAYTDAQIPFSVMVVGESGLMHTNGAFGFLTPHGSGAVNSVTSSNGERNSPQYLGPNTPFVGTRRNGEFSFVFGWPVGSIPLPAMVNGRGGLGILVGLGKQPESDSDDLELYGMIPGYRADLVDGEMDVGLAVPVVYTIADNGTYIPVPRESVGIEANRWVTFTNWQRPEGNWLALGGWDGDLQLYRPVEPFQTTALNTGGLPYGSVVAIIGDGYQLRLPVDHTTQYRAGGELEETVIPHVMGDVTLSVTDSSGVEIFSTDLELPANGGVQVGYGAGGDIETRIIEP